MIELNIETISIAIACISIVVGVASVVDKNRREIKTRQANLLMQIGQYLTDHKFQKDWFEVLFLEKWRTLKEYEERYGLGEHLDDEVKVPIIQNWFETLGTLVKEKLIDPRLLYKTHAGITMMTWKRLEPKITRQREIRNNPYFLDSFEYLGKQFKKMQEDEQTGVPIPTVTEFVEEREKLLKKDQQEVKKDD